MGSIALALAAAPAAADAEAPPIAPIIQVAATAAGPATSPELSAAPSNVCVTQYGVCPVVPGTTRGAPCQCFLSVANMWAPGVAEYWVSSVPTEIP